MGLFGFGSKKETPADTKMSLSTDGSVACAKCVLTAGVRDVDIDVDTSGSGPLTLNHGSFSAMGDGAITTYLDRKGRGQSVRPKKARVLGDQNYWIEVSNMLDKGEQVEAVLNRLNSVLGDNQFIAGPLSLADPAVAGSVLALKKSGKLPSGLSNIDAWLGRVEQKIPENLRSTYMGLVS